MTNRSPEFDGSLATLDHTMDALVQQIRLAILRVEALRAGEKPLLSLVHAWVRA